MMTGRGAASPRLPRPRARFCAPGGLPARLASGASAVRSGEVRPPRPALALVLLAVSCASYDPASAPTRGTTGRDFAERVPGALPMKNVAKIDEGVWRGGEPDAAGLRALREQGF